MANNTNLSYPSAFCQQFFDKNGKPLVGGKLYTYIAGSSTPVVTYKTISGGTESANRNTNPIILDMVGMAKLVISNDTAYKFILFDRNNVKIDEWDNVTAGGNEGGSSNVYVEGTSGEIDVDEESEGRLRRFIISLSDSVKNAISDLSSSVNDIINALYNKKDKQQPVNKQGSATKVPVSFSQNANGEMDVEFDDIAFPDWTTAINNAVSNCEKTSNKKNSVTGYESSTTAYPSIKAVVDFVNSIMQNLGGKLITYNGNPFSDSDDLPSTTPYQGVTISDKDYAYVQGTGFAERWSASVSGSDVTWVQEYSINIPVFTPAQQAAIDSGATSTKINNYELHINNTAIHVTSSEKNAWNAKQNAIGDLAEIRSGAAAGATALQPNGNCSNVTSTFTAASSRTNISSGEKLSTIFGKIAKWFTDLKAVAFSGSYNDLTNTPTIPTVNNGKLTIKQNGTSKGTFSANQSSDNEINLTDTTYESKNAASGGTAVSLVTTGEKYNWNAKQNAISDLAEIRSGASAGASALQPSGNGSNVTSTFTAASSRTNISSGEKLSTIFGKIAKWFADLKSVAFSGSYSDLSDTPTIPEAATATPQAVSASSGSTGSSDYFAKGDHVHKIVVSEGVNDGQVSIAGKSVSVKGWSTKQNALPKSTTPTDTYSINVSGSSDHTIKSKIAFGVTYSSAASVTKSVNVVNNIDYSEHDFFIAVTFVNGNTHQNYINLSFNDVSYTITDSRVKWIRAGETYLFKLNTATTSDGKLVGDLNTIASLEENAKGTTYTFTDNRGIAKSVNAYPYQSPIGVEDTFRYNTQSFTNGTGGSLTKILLLNESGEKTLNWSKYVESRFDFIDMTIRICGFYTSTNANAEVITIEPYKYSNSYISVGLPELSNYILLLNDGVMHQFSFTVHFRMSYKEFLASIGGTNTTLYLGFTFGASSSSSNKHSITFANVWTRVTYHGDHS